MWSTLENILIPIDFAEAISASKKSKSSFFAGGSYLVSEKNHDINTLIDISNLINNEIFESDEAVSIGSGVRIESIVKHFATNSVCQLSQATLSSCPSKNIRNQRSIGGEIAKQRVDSDLFVYLNAVKPVLTIKRPDNFEISIDKWDGKGIINKIVIKTKNIMSSNFQRFALIPSAPAFLIISAVRRANYVDIAIGGNAKNLFAEHCNFADLKDNYLHNIAQAALTHFDADHLGSLDYKKLILLTGLRRMTEGL